MKKIILMIFIILMVAGESFSEPFINNMDGTVTDAGTGLTWQQNYLGSLLSWQEALDYCNGLDLTGKNDWRLPNIKELTTIVDLSKYNPSIYSAFPSTIIALTLHWTSTTSVSEPNYAWIVDFNRGRSGVTPKGDSIQVRCVRGN